MEEFLMTEKEKEREKEHKEICKKFVYLREKYPDAPPNRFFVSIARERGKSSAGIRKICINCGVHHPDSKNNDDTGTTESEQHGTLQRP